MKISELVSAVAVAILREELAPDPVGGMQGTGRFALNLNSEQTAAVAQAVLADPALHREIELKLPATVCRRLRAARRSAHNPSGDLFP